MTIARKTTNEGTRLNVYLQERGVASRRKADSLIEEGHVAINGTVITTLGYRVPKGAQVTLNGKPLQRAVPHQTYLFFKPDLCLTSRVDPGNRKTIFDFPDLGKLPRNVQAVGRLDFRSEGLLLLTNDGDMAYALTHPRFSVEKKYACLLSDLITPDEIERLRQGVELDDGPARPVSVRVGSKENLGATKKGHWIEVVVTEGRNRLIRRMLDTLGHRVVRLVRVAIGDLQLPLDMKPGEMRALQGETLRYLEKMRDEFLNTNDASPDATPAVRPSRRKAHLNDDAYLEERLRRSIASQARERERLSKKPPERSARTPQAEESTTRAPVRRTTERSAIGQTKRPAPERTTTERSESARPRRSEDQEVKRPRPAPAKRPAKRK